MKNTKKIVCYLAAIFMIGSFSSVASAKDNGVVDIGKVVDNFSEAQKISAELKVKEQDLQKFVIDAQKKVKEAKSPVEQKNLEEKYGEEFNLKRNALVNEQAEKWDVIEGKINKAVAEMAEVKKLDMVFTKQAVIFGGVDITEDLIKKLNGTTSTK